MHSNWDIVIGQERAQRILRTAVKSERIAHAYLLTGNEGSGTEALALAFARTLLCERKGDDGCGVCSSCIKSEHLHHPDLKLIFPLPGGDNDKNDEGESLESDVLGEVLRQTEEKGKDPYFHIEIPKAKFIRIKSIREIKKESSMSSTENGRKVFVIFDADAMNDPAANSLLKILEEPLDDVHFVLTSSRKDALKQTIMSRCQLVQCSVLSDGTITESLIEREHVELEQAHFIARLSGGNYTRAKQLLSSDLQKYRTDTVGFLRSILGPSALKIFEEQEEYLAGNKREEAENLLTMLHVWLRDAIIVRENAETVFNIDQGSDLKSFVGRFGTKDLERSLSSVERALELLRRNVYLPLVMLSFIVQLRSILHAK